MILIASSRGTLANKLLTTNDIILYFLGNLSFFRRLMKSGVLIIVQSDFPNGASKLAKYFAVLYVNAPALETMGLNVSSCNPSPFYSLCTLSISIECTGF